jgi:hypothetical protein
MQRSAEAGLGKFHKKRLAMMGDANLDDIIEQFVLGTLEGNQLIEFQSKLLADPELKNEVALQQDLIGNIKTYGRKELREKLDVLHNRLTVAVFPEQIRSGGNKIRRLPTRHWQKKYWISAACILFLIVSAGLITLYNKTANHDALLETYYKPFSTIKGYYRSLQPSVLSEKDQAFREYDKGDYQSSVRLFTSLLEKGDDEVSLFFLANAFLAEGNLLEAEKAFLGYLQHYRKFHDETQWYLSITYLKEKKVKEAKRLLRELANRQNDYSKNAKDILMKW